MESLRIITIFAHPLDYPAGYVARAFYSAPGVVYRGELIAHGPTLESVREQLRAAPWGPGLTRLPRHPTDDPKIVESWL